MNTKTIGVLAILGGSLMWATEPILAKLSYANSTFLETLQHLCRVSELYFYL